MDKKARATPHPSFEALETTIIKAWDKLDKGYIRKACQAFRGHFEAIIEAEGGHIA